MRTTLALLMLVAGCNKGSRVASNGSATAPGSDMHAAVETLDAVDELDRWIAPIYKLAVPDRYRAMCHSADTIRGKVKALGAMPAPAGTDAQRWSDATDKLADDVAGVGMCCQDLEDYEKGSAALKEVSDGNHDDCMKPVLGSFAAVAKMVPGAPAPGTHANDPVMAAPK